MLKKFPEKRRPWHLLDAGQEPLGRLAVKIANLLSGKNKVDRLPNLDEGDSVVVVNASLVVVTGKKERNKLYYRYSGYPGGLKEESLAHLRKRKPEEIIRHAVAGMLPRNKLQARRLARLKIYSGPKHPHQAQIVAGKNANVRIQEDGEKS